MQTWRIYVCTFALDIWSKFPIMIGSLIRHYPNCLMSIEYNIDSIFDNTRPISIFYSEYILSLIMFCPEVSIKSCAK
jgi:hypothetical protein